MPLWDFFLSGHVFWVQSWWQKSQIIKDNMCCFRKWHKHAEHWPLCLESLWQPQLGRNAYIKKLCLISCLLCYIKQRTVTIFPNSHVTKSNLGWFLLLPLHQPTLACNELCIPPDNPCCLIWLTAKNTISTSTNESTISGVHFLLHTKQSYFVY